MNLIAKYAATYRKCRPVYDRYRKSDDKEKFLRGHESEIILFEAAARELKRLGAVPLPAVEKLDTELKKLTVWTGTLYAQYTTAKRKAKEYDTIKRNLEHSAPAEAEHYTRARIKRRMQYERKAGHYRHREGAQYAELV